MIGGEKYQCKSDEFRFFSSLDEKIFALFDATLLTRVSRGRCGVVGLHNGRAAIVFRRSISLRCAWLIEQLTEFSNSILRRYRWWGSSDGSGRWWSIHLLHVPHVEDGTLFYLGTHRERSLSSVSEYYSCWTGSNSDDFRACRRRRLFRCFHWHRRQQRTRERERNGKVTADAYQLLSHPISSVCFFLRWNWNMTLMSDVENETSLWDRSDYYLPVCTQRRSVRCCLPQTFSSQGGMSVYLGEKERFHLRVFFSLRVEYKTR